MATNEIQRPGQVEQAATFFWGSLVFSGMSLYYDLKSDEHLPAATQLFSVAIAYAFLAFLIFKIAAGRNWARYTSLILTVIWLPFGIFTTVDDFSRNAVLSLLGAASVVVQLMGLWLIFTSPGKNWFRKQPLLHDEPQVSPNPRSTTLADKLIQLKELRDKELISADDFERKKAALLAEF